jgi:hypothetical protein
MDEEAASTGRFDSLLARHAKSSVTDDYSKLADDLEYRLEVTQKIGAGFTVPASTRPMRPRKSVETEMESAA